MEPVILASPERLKAALHGTQPVPMTAEAVIGAIHPTATHRFSGVFNGVAADSRLVQPGYLFVAIRGEQVDGHDYIRDAWEAGARGVVVEQSRGLPEIGWAQVAHARRALASLADASFGSPSKTVQCMGITGTKGKTSTSYFLRHLLKQAADGPAHPTGVIGTLGLAWGPVTLPLPLTTPESIQLQRMLACLRDLGAEAAVMEVSAHGVAFDRTRDIRFRYGILTNLGQDHLDFFKTMEAYAAAKRQFLCEQVPGDGGTVILNSDDPFGAECATRVPAELRITYGTKKDAQVRGFLRQQGRGSLRVEMGLRGGSIEVVVPIAGAFNLHNLLAAAAAAEAYGVSPAAIAAGLATLPAVPGRHEVVSTSADDVTVVVDYAHTPQSVAAILASADRERQHVIAIVGCGGDRDRSKRPQMGRLAYEGSDALVLTSDNPRSEDPQAILNEIVAGLPQAARAEVRVESDRAQAIAETITNAPSHAAIYILGKGHEPYQILADRTIAFDDREHAREALAKRRARIGAGV